MGNKVELLTAWKFKKCNFQSILLNWIISVIYKGTFTKFDTHLVEGHLEGTLSQIFNLGIGIKYFLPFFATQFSRHHKINFIL